MTRSILYLVVVLSGLLLNFPAAAQKMSFVDAEGRGDGTTRIDATQQALIMAIGQVNGAQLAAQMSSQLQAVTTTSDDNETFKSTEAYQEAVSQKTKGVIRSWKILSETKDDENIWTVTVLAKIAKYKLSKQLNRIRIAVLPFRLSENARKLGKKWEFVDRIRRSTAAYLTQSRRFAVLDRDYSKEQSEELKFATKPGVRTEELARLGNLVAVDLIVVGTLENLNEHRRKIKIKATGRRISSVKSTASFSYRVIDVATRQVKFADTKTLNADGKIRSLVRNIGDTIGETILNAIYPILVVAVDKKHLTLGQGGRTLRVGQKLELINFGEEIFDAYTKEYLGRKEITVGVIKITRVRSHQSSARILKSTKDINADFSPEMYIVRPYPNDSNTRGNTAGIKTAGEKDLDKDLDTLKKKSKDDW